MQPVLASLSSENVSRTLTTCRVQEALRSSLLDEEALTATFRPRIGDTAGACLAAW